MAQKSPMGRLPKQQAQPTPKSESGARTSRDAEREADLLLVQRVLQHDRNAANEFYKRFSSNILRRLYRLLGNERDAEDGLQQVFLEAYRSLSKFRGDGPLGGWLNRISTHVAMDVLRKRNRWRAIVEDVSLPKTTKQNATTPLPDVLFLREETKQLVWQLVSRLGPKKRMAVMICDLEGKTIEQAAAELEIPEGTMISRLYHGRRELMTLLKSESLKQEIPLGDWIRD